MRRRIHRIIALILLPALVVDPAHAVTYAAHSAPPRNSKIGQAAFQQARFNENALTLGLIQAFETFVRSAAGLRKHEWGAWHKALERDTRGEAESYFKSPARSRGIRWLYAKIPNALIGTYAAVTERGIK